MSRLLALHQLERVDHLAHRAQAFLLPPARRLVLEHLAAQLVAPFGQHARPPLHRVVLEQGVPDREHGDEGEAGDQAHQQRVGGQAEREDLVERVHQISNLIILAITPSPIRRLVSPMPIITQPRGSLNRVFM